MVDTQLGRNVAAQEFTEPAGVEVIGVVGQAGIFGRVGTAGRTPCFTQGRLKGDVVGEYILTCPISGKIDRREALRRGEGVIIAVLAVAPANEFRALLEGGVAVADKVDFGDAYTAQGFADGRPGTFADSDRLGRQRFDQADLEATTIFGGNQSGREPARRAPADDDNVPDRLHRCFPVFR